MPFSSRYSKQCLFEVGLSNSWSPRLLCLGIQLVSSLLQFNQCCYQHCSMGFFFFFFFFFLDGLFFERYFWAGKAHVLYQLCTSAIVQGKPHSLLSGYYHPSTPYSNATSSQKTSSLHLEVNSASLLVPLSRSSSHAMF